MAAFKRPAVKVPGSRDHPSAGRGVKVCEREASPIQLPNVPQPSSPSLVHTQLLCIGRRCYTKRTFTPSSKHRREDAFYLRRATPADSRLGHLFPLGLVLL